MAVGPVEYIVVAFPGNKFTGKIAPALADLVQNGTIRILDLAFVAKDADGNVVAMELSDLPADDAAEFDSLGASAGGLFNDEELASAGDELEPNSAAALLVWENLWAKTFVDAVREADGELLDYDRIPHDVAEAALDWAQSNY
jgi:uncharacterized membrane protein